MGRLGGNARPVVGVDLEGPSMGVVQARRTNHGVRIDGAAEVARLDPSAPLSDSDVGLLLDVMGRMDFDDSTVVVGVPAERLFSEVLEMPPRDSGAPVERLARMEVARIRHRDSESFELACWDLPAPVRAGDATHMLGVGCDHEAANELLDMFESRGVFVRALDVRSCAIARALETEAGAGVTGVVEIGWDRTRLVALLGGVVLYERRVEDAGLRAVRDEVIRVLDVEEEVADYLLLGGAPAADERIAEACASILESSWMGAVEEINTSLGYAEHRYRDAELRRLLLIGPGARLPTVSALLREALGVEPEIVAIEDLASPESVDAVPPGSTSLVPAFGFAMWEA